MYTVHRYSTPGGDVTVANTDTRRAQDEPGRVGDAPVTTFKREVKVEVKVVGRSAAVRVDGEHRGQSARIVDAARQSFVSSHAVTLYLQGLSVCLSTPQLWSVAAAAAASSALCF